ncbi:protein STRUBBELIG-RECEPTOR FAMILY 8-like isoform X4 [Miscanthus floridulus]|uniref:protein STRUBBELIG-RECEPTOR FAMILY 8-like isoform X4 n=1 Tax=Miscanthus floridulus TaxID=154761 RepID=UPI003459E5C0
MGAPRHLLAVAMLCALFASAASFTDPPDALGLWGLYRTLESPWQLSGWTFQGGDPCGEGRGSKHWRGIVCKGSSIVTINISGLGVGGWLGPDMLKFQSLKKLLWCFSSHVDDRDMSFNNIAGEIPPTLPPNVEYLNLAANKFEGNIPSSLPWLHSLKYLDLSFNAFNGDLPRSFSSLTNLRYLYLHHNEFTGSVILLAGLPLSSLNIENNHFSGYVPGPFQSIPELRIDGNQFQPGFKHASSSFTRRTPPAPPQSQSPPPPLTQSSPQSLPPPPPAAKQKPKQRPKSPKPSFGYSSLQNNSHHGKSHSRVTAAAIASATCTVFVLLIVGLVLKSRKSCSCNPKSTSNHAKTLPANMETVPKANEVLYSWSSLLIGSDTSSSNGITSERVPKIKSWFKTSKNLLTAKQFPAADILAATRDFNGECFIGEGLTGRVYRGDFSDGQLLAIKRIDMVDLSLSEQDELMDMLWNISRLKHPNISALVGYCVEFGHCVLLYEYAENGSLDDILFSAATRSRALSWKARMKIALGVAYALEYMHLTCSPPVAHGNIKARNILLDAQLMPYLCDSGLTKLSHFVSTTRMKDPEAITSAKGYAAPELSDPGADVIKADIYSFGVILLVLLTGQKAFDSSRRQNEQFLVDWAAPHLDDLDSLERITDPRIRGSMPPKAISSLGIIILLCVKQSPDLRPPMTIIADKLVKLVESTGLQKISTTQHLEVDAQDPSFITSRPYFERSSTVRVEQRAASPGDECLSFFPNSSGSYAALSSRWHSKYIEFTTVAPLSAFLTHDDW